MPPKPGGTLRAAFGLQVPGTAHPAVSRAARATRTPVFLPPARFSRAYPPVAAAPLRVDGCHTTRPRALTRGACFARHTGSGTGLPHGVERRYHPARVWQALRALPVANALWQPPASGPVRSPPLLCRSGILSASAPDASSQAPCVPDALAASFHLPSVAAAAASRRAPATTPPGAGGGSRASGARALRVDTRPSPHARRQCRLPPRRALDRRTTSRSFSRTTNRYGTTNSRRTTTGGG